MLPPGPRRCNIFSDAACYDSNHRGRVPLQSGYHLNYGLTDSLPGTFVMYDIDKELS